MEEMFCFQCQQTAHNSGCEGRAGVCGKKSDTANYQDELTGALIGLSRAVRKKLALNPDASFEHADELILKGLFTTITNVNFFNDTIIELIREVNVEKDRIYPDIMNYDVHHIWEDQEDIRSLKSLILFGLRGMAAYAYHAYALDYVDRNVLDFFYEGLEALGSEKSSDELLALVLKTGEINFRCMELLDHANSGTYGNPVPTEVPLTIEKGPFIVVSGHDLHDMELLLKQTEGKGINIYTHSEMLPAHYYPELKKYPHLYGNYGNAWHRQNSEFAAFNGPILMTTNCITPVQESYRNRIFTTGMAGYPGIPHIADRKDGSPKDFSAIIALARTCPPPTPLEDGTIVGGFAHDQVLALADKVVAAVKSGAIKRFVVMAGCDGRQKTREYFTDVASGLPEGTVILTAGCAKYRYNKLPLGDIGDIPRVLDAGQCNDSYSLAVIALKLREAFDLDDVNRLPLSFDIAWYEQKAVAVLLALLALGFRNIRLGPTLPAFLSPGVAKILAETFGLKPTAEAKADTEAMMQGK